MGSRKDIIILGTGGNCLDILDLINELGRDGKGSSYRCAGFLDDDQSRWGLELYGVRVLGPLASAAQFQSAAFVNGIGSPKNFWKRAEIVRSTGLPDDRFVTLIHPTASVSSMARLGVGCVVLQQVTIASNAQLADHVTVLPNSVVSHDDQIGNFTEIAGGVCVSGGVTVGESCYLGTNSAIIGNVRIGNRCLVGMGSVVLADVPDETVVVGNPARPLRRVGEPPLKHDPVIGAKT
jgi:sugar O-acyltransferase (sialic acid O-acetyltransferase NeuD family)